MAKSKHTSVLEQHPGVVQKDYQGKRTIILIPSIGLGALCQQSIAGLQFFEERYLYYIIFLKQPNTQLVAVLSKGMEPAILEYFFVHASQATGCTIADLKRRFTLLIVPTKKNSTLTENILRSNAVQRKIKKAVQYTKDVYIEFWNVTQTEIRLAEKIGVPYYGLRSTAIRINSKAGARKIFQKSGLDIAVGKEVHTLKAAYDALRRLTRHSKAHAFLIKLNNEGSGVGIIKVQRSDMQGTFQQFRTQIVLPTCQDLTLFEKYIRLEGCVVEEFIEAKYVESPSVQFDVDPDGKIQPISTHDQLLYGMDYFGTRFPANAAYRKQIVGVGKQVMKQIVKIGGQSFIAMDLLVTRSARSGKWKMYGIEINARKGGANHTHMWAKYLTGASYDTQRGILKAATGDVYYKASEKFLFEPWLKRISPERLLRTIQDAGLDFNHKKQSGVFVHLLSPLRHFGKFGVTVIGHSESEVERLWKQLFVAVQKLKGCQTEVKMSYPSRK